MEKGVFEKQYSVAIDTVPLPETPADRIDLAQRSFEPLIQEIMQDIMRVAIGSWPTPEDPGFQG